MLYIACTMAFVWRTSPQSTAPPADVSKRDLVAVRLIIITVLWLGILYGCLILDTFSRYGEATDSVKSEDRRLVG